MGAFIVALLAIVCTILGMTMEGLGFLYFATFVLGIVAWSVGNSQWKANKKNGFALAGKIIGMIITIIAIILIILFILTLVGVFVAGTALF